MSFSAAPNRPSTSPASARRPQLPSIPPGSSRRRMGGGMDMSVYQLNPSHFPSWPPENASREENQWYSMARQHRGLQKAQAMAQLQSSADEGRPDLTINTSVGGGR